MKLPNQTRYVMTIHSPRYRSRCLTCGGLVRLGRKFVVDPVRTEKIHHAGCYERK